MYNGTKSVLLRKREKLLVSINAVCIVDFFFFLRGVNQPPQNLTAANYLPWITVLCSMRVSWVVLNGASHSVAGRYPRDCRPLKAPLMWKFKMAPLFT